MCACSRCLFLNMDTYAMSTKSGKSMGKINCLERNITKHLHLIFSCVVEFIFFSGQKGENLGLFCRSLHELQI